jgi:hypothetical protein
MFARIVMSLHRYLQRHFCLFGWRFSFMTLLEDKAIGEPGPSAEVKIMQPEEVI